MKPFAGWLRALAAGMLLSLVVFLCPPMAIAASDAVTPGINPETYKLAKGYSAAYCEALSDGLSVGEASDYAASEIKWRFLRMAVAWAWEHRTDDETSGSDGAAELLNGFEPLVTSRVKQCSTAAQMEEFSKLDLEVAQATE